MGQVIRAYRHHPLHGPRPLSQELVARWLNVTQTYLSRIESGPAVTDLNRLISWARALGIPPEFLWFKLPEERQEHVPVGVPHPRQPSASSLPTAAQPSALMPPPGVVPMSGGNPDVVALHAFRAADRQVGGGHLYATVTSYLQTSIAPRLFGAQGANNGADDFIAAGGFTEMAGWMAHDAGHDSVANRHFHRSLDLARMGGDAQLSAHVHASLSHLFLHLGKPKDAIHRARQGHSALTAAPPMPALSARLFAMEARGLAALDDSAACTGALLQAEKTLERSFAEEPSPWVSPFDAGSLASEAARCMRQLGHLEEAEHQARQVMELRAGGHTRSRAFAQLLLVNVLIAQGEPEEACAIAREVLDATQALSSHLVTQQLDELRSLLEPYRTSPTVAEFLPWLEEVVRRRAGLYSWLASGSVVR